MKGANASVHTTPPGMRLPGSAGGVVLWSSAEASGVAETGCQSGMPCRHTSVAAVSFTACNQASDVVFGHIVVTYAIFLVMPGHCFSFLTEVIKSVYCLLLLRGPMRQDFANTAEVRKSPNKARLCG
ncbi:Uncharacterised protein [Citrobacter amalonaticus]|nr:Uncharacterised protein [Citrobacter amalonaticus]